MTKQEMTAEIERLKAENAALATARETAQTPRKERDCACGCGEQTKGGVYRPGHDARYHSALRHAGQQVTAMTGRTFAPIAPKAPAEKRMKKSDLQAAWFDVAAEMCA